MKRFVLCTLSALAVMSSCVYAGGDITIFVKGEEIDTHGTIVNGRTMVPVRGVFEKLGYTDITFDPETKTAVIKNHANSSVVITAGETTFTANGSEVVPDVPQQIIDGYFYIPLRAVSEAVGAKVDWDPETKIVSIKKGINVIKTDSLDQIP